MLEEMLSGFSNGRWVLGKFESIVGINLATMEIYNKAEKRLKCIRNDEEIAPDLDKLVKRCNYKNILPVANTIKKLYKKSDKENVKKVINLLNNSKNFNNVVLDFQLANKKHMVSEFIKFYEKNNDRKNIGKISISQAFKKEKADRKKISEVLEFYDKHMEHKEINNIIKGLECAHLSYVGISGFVKIMDKFSDNNLNEIIKKIGDIFSSRYGIVIDELLSERSYGEIKKSKRPKKLIREGFPFLSKQSYINKSINEKIGYEDYKLIHNTFNFVYEFYSKGISQTGLDIKQRNFLDGLNDSINTSKSFEEKIDNLRTYCKNLYSSLKKFEKAINSASNRNCDESHTYMHIIGIEEVLGRNASYKAINALKKYKFNNYVLQAIRAVAQSRDRELYSEMIDFCSNYPKRKELEYVALSVGNVVKNNSISSAKKLIEFYKKSSNEYDCSEIANIFYEGEFSLPINKVIDISTDYLDKLGIDSFKNLEEVAWGRSNIEVCLPEEIRNSNSIKLIDKTYKIINSLHANRNISDKQVMLMGFVNELLRSYDQGSNICSKTSNLVTYCIDVQQNLEEHANELMVNTNAA